jgi:glutathione S-transferase
MATAVILQSVVPVALSMYSEYALLPGKFPVLYRSSTAAPFALLPKAYSLVILVNVVATALVLVVLGLKVASARSRFTEKAAKNGDKEAEARFSYPKLYAEGFSTEAKLFNCVQRGHQQPFETYTQFVALSLIGGIRFPITVSFAGVIWILARFMWAEGYATGEPSRRYDSMISRGIWSSLIAVLASAVGVAAAIAGVI